MMAGEHDAVGDATSRTEGGGWRFEGWSYLAGILVALLFVNFGSVSDWLARDDDGPTDPAIGEPLLDHGPHEGVSVQIDARGDRIIAETYTIEPGSRSDLGSAEGVSRVMVPDAADEGAPAVAWASPADGGTVLTMVDDVHVTFDDPPTIDVVLPVDEVLDFASTSPGELGIDYKLLVFGTVEDEFVAVPVTIPEREPGVAPEVVLGEVQRLDITEFPEQLAFINLGFPGSGGLVVDDDPLYVVDMTGRGGWASGVELSEPIDVHEPPEEE